MLAIGASTGGPQALATVLAALVPIRGYAVVIVQHLDQTFVPGFVEWLASATKAEVRSIQDGDQPESGTVHVACTADHLVITSSGDFHYVAAPAELVYRPSVDVLFDSLLASRVSPGVALLLTGMGRDGAAGMKALRDAGWKTIAQDQHSSIVWGMPGAAVKLNAADRVLPLSEIGPAVGQLIKSRIHTPGASHG